MTAILDGFRSKGRASILIGGQWGSEGKGAAAAWVAETLLARNEPFDWYTTNAGAQAGHTSILPSGTKIVLFHLPTAAIVTRMLTGAMGNIYLNSGAVIDPDVFEREVNEYMFGELHNLHIHPMAAVITTDCREASMDPNSQNTKIAGVRKGVGQAISRRVLRTGMIAKDHPVLRPFVRRVDLNNRLENGASILVEVPQGVSLSLGHSRFYPYTTSRDCTPANALADAAIHPSFMGQTLLVLRTFPIRVGNIPNSDTSYDKPLGYSGPAYSGQKELTWADIGVEAEITTVSKRVRRVFNFSPQQLQDTLALTRPDVILLTFCNYCPDNGALDKIYTYMATALTCPVPVYTQWGPKSTDVKPIPLMLGGGNYLRPMEAAQ